jgi:tetratricopeptide (TPR) repeat protein
VNSRPSLAGVTRPPASNIPSGRPDLGGNFTGQTNTVFRPNIPGSDTTGSPGAIPLPSGPGDNRPSGNRPGDNRPGGNRPGDYRPGGNRPGDDRPGNNRPGDNRPGNNRPGDDGRPDWANRPGRPDWDNRPNHDNDGNRWSGNNWNNNNHNWNSNNRNWNVNNNWTSNRQNIVNNSPTIIGGGYRPGFAVPGYGYGYGGNWGYGQQGVYDNSWQCGPGWAPAYGALHDDWCHGSWTGYGDNSNWLNYAAGAATGWLSSWAFGSRPYSWGYSSYSNPYYDNTVSQTVVGNYDYSQPLNTEVAPPPQEQAQPATATLDMARQAFLNGAYDQALTLANQVVATLPNDPTVHEFRALALFALGRYDEASQALYPVLSIGPGWDWSTMSGLYPSVDVYQPQLTALENYVRNHPDRAAPQFLLAYHYLTLGYNEAAADLLRQVVQLKPADNLSRQMLTLLDSAKQQAAVAEQTPAAQPAPQAAAPPMAEAPATIQPAQLTGVWTAKPDNKSSISLSLDPNGKFVWNVVQRGQPNKLSGNFTIGDGDLLTLAQGQQGGTMAGNVTMTQNDQFTFRLVGAPASDPGLTFVRQL